LEVKVEHLVLTDQDVPLSDAVFHVPDFVNEFAIVLHKQKRLPDITFHQSTADKYFRSFRRVDSAIGNRPPGNND